MPFDVRGALLFISFLVCVGDDVLLALVVVRCGDGECLELVRLAISSLFFCGQ